MAISMIIPCSLCTLAVQSTYSLGRIAKKEPHLSSSSWFCSHLVFILCTWHIFPSTGMWLTNGSPSRSSRVFSRIPSSERTKPTHLFLRSRMSLYIYLLVPEHYPVPVSFPVFNSIRNITCRSRSKVANLIQLQYNSTSTSDAAAITEAAAEIHSMPQLTTRDHLLYSNRSRRAFISVIIFIIVFCCVSLGLVGK